MTKTSSRPSSHQQHTKDGHRPPRRNVAGVRVVDFAHRKGVTRAIQEYKKRRETKSTEKAKMLRRYRKVMKQEGYDAGAGASRKRQDTTSEENNNNNNNNNTSEENNNNNNNNESSKTIKPKRGNPFQKSLQKAKHQAEKQKTKELEQQANERQRKERLKERRERSKLVRKRTKRGQPIMKHMVDNLLIKLEKQKSK